MAELHYENMVIDNLKEHFQQKILETKIQRAKRVIVKTTAENIESVLLYLKEKLGYLHLSHMSCVDWIEENRFELVYILWHPEQKINVLVKIDVDRMNPVAPNIDYIWDQANTYEREIREMYGIEFTGLVAPKELILEDWDDMPPMRRDFDTLKYVMENYTFRPGREDAQDVRETIAKRTGEEIPEFAKKYSR
jgi:NADH-quinone oxidoreductase subunit C